MRKSRLFEIGQIGRSLGIVKLAPAKPAPLEAIPEKNGIQLPSEFVDAPAAFILDLLPRRVEGDAIEFANRVDRIPVGSDVSVFERDMIRPARLPSGNFTPREEAATLRQKLRYAGHRICDAARLIQSQLTARE